MRLTIDAGGRAARAEVVAPLLLVLATLLWGSNFIFGRVVGQELSPITISFWRWAGALAFLLPLSGGELLRQRRLLLAHWRLIGLLSLTGIAAYNVCVYSALRATSGVNAALFAALLPLAIMLAARLLDRERLRLAQLPGVAISLLGAVVVVTRGDPGALLGLGLNAGDLWMLGAVPLWAVYAVLQRRRPAGLSSLGLVTAAVVGAVLMLAPLYAAEAVAGATALPSTGAALGLAYAALGPSAVGYVLWNRGASVLGPARAGVYTNLIPVFGALLSVTILGEALEGYHMAGAALVMVGIVAAARGRGAGRPPAQPGRRRALALRLALLLVAGVYGLRFVIRALPAELLAAAEPGSLMATLFALCGVGPLAPAGLVAGQVADRAAWLAQLPLVAGYAGLILLINTVAIVALRRRAGDEEGK
ncbi:MAG TPA: DMT family transporter [Chloroflexaceae bacterium]|nr:DMT family transporter [Chloroflexaceae bacterium]